ncbi:MAG TPA: hypothetical protein VHB27_20605, partial [Rhodopila sp.]|uniref:hypothetical protein n=1 Tax=Rhodopila sp. TaxID=2480087 RepID=UPI002D192412
MCIAIGGMLSSIIQKWVCDSGHDPNSDQSSSQNKYLQRNELRWDRGAGKLSAHIDAVAQAINAYHNKRDAHERH